MSATSPQDDASLRLGEAKRRIDDAIVAIVDVESIPLGAALGRVLAHDLISPIDVPAHHAAAMDGYALHSGGGSGTGASRRRIVGRALAGEPYTGSVEPDECVRIMTGAMMPRGCDAVVPQEEAIAHGDEVEFPGSVRVDQHRRRAGEDLARGAVAIERGRRITPSDLGLAASIGASTISVLRRLRVAVFSTGTELRALDQVLEQGSVHDSNRYTLIGMLERLGAEVIDLGIVGDDRDALEAALKHACSGPIRADAVITSGGVSAGDADYTREVMRNTGRVSFWKLAIKPGRPMAFGSIDLADGHQGRSALLFGLPGNPVAMMVVFHALVRDALLKLMGARVDPLACLQLVCDTRLSKPAGRTEFVRGIAFRAEDGWHVRPTGAQGSSMLRSMSQANCLIVLDHDRGDVMAGEIVEAWPFEGLV